MDAADERPEGADTTNVNNNNNNTNENENNNETNNNNNENRYVESATRTKKKTLLPEVLSSITTAFSRGPRRPLDRPEAVDEDVNSRQVGAYRDEVVLGDGNTASSAGDLSPLKQAQGMSSASVEAPKTKAKAKTKSKDNDKKQDKKQMKAKSKNKNKNNHQQHSPAASMKKANNGSGRSTPVHSRNTSMAADMTTAPSTGRKASAIDFSKQPTNGSNARSPNGNLYVPSGGNANGKMKTPSSSYEGSYHPKGIPIDTGKHGSISVPAAGKSQSRSISPIDIAKAKKRERDNIIFSAHSFSVAAGRARNHEELLEKKALTDKKRSEKSKVKSNGKQRAKDDKLKKAQKKKAAREEKEKLRTDPTEDISSILNDITSPVAEESHNTEDTANKIEIPKDVIEDDETSVKPSMVIPFIKTPTEDAEKDDIKSPDSGRLSPSMWVSRPRSVRSGSISDKLESSYASRSSSRSSLESSSSKSRRGKNSYYADPHDASSSLNESTDSDITDSDESDTTSKDSNETSDDYDSSGSEVIRQAWNHHNSRRGSGMSRRDMIKSHIAEGRRRTISSSKSAGNSVKSHVLGSDTDEEWVDSPKAMNEVELAENESTITGSARFNKSKSPNGRRRQVEEGIKEADEESSPVDSKNVKESNGVNGEDTSSHEEEEEEEDVDQDVEEDDVSELSELYDKKLVNGIDFNKFAQILLDNSGKSSIPFEGKSTDGSNAATVNALANTGANPTSPLSEGDGYVDLIRDHRNKNNFHYDHVNRQRSGSDALNLGDIPDVVDLGMALVTSPATPTTAPEGAESGQIPNTIHFPTASDGTIDVEGGLHGPLPTNELNSPDMKSVPTTSSKASSSDPLIKSRAKGWFKRLTRL